MKKIIEGLKRSGCLIAVLLLMSLASVSTAGCAGRTRTTTVTTETTNGAVGGGSTTSVTTQKNQETDSHPRGVIGGLFYTVGQVILWPFKVIGSLFS